MADVKNIGIRWGGAITAALFLKEFVGDIPWAHLDVAGTAFAEQPGDVWPRGATGSPARTLIRYIEGQAGRGRAPRTSAPKASRPRKVSSRKSSARGSGSKRTSPRRRG